MKTLVIYKSEGGSTKKYAEDIAKNVEGDVLPIKKFKAKLIKNYDNIVFGGWVNSGEIKGLNEFLAEWDSMEGKNVIVFSCGISNPSKEGRDSLISDNLLNMYHLRFYQLKGSFNINNLGFTYRTLLTRLVNQFKTDPDATLSQKNIAYFVEHPVEYYDNEGVEKISNVIHSLNVVEVKSVEK